MEGEGRGEGEGEGEGEETIILFACFIWLAMVVGKIGFFE